jgi:hypothetical protein
MSIGLNFQSNWDSVTIGESVRSIIRKPNNRTNVLSCGNLKTLNPGESISVAFAVICAKKDNQEGLPNTSDTRIQRKNLRANAILAQTTYNGEDVNGNGLLDPNEDYNQNGRIDRYLISGINSISFPKDDPDNGQIKFELFPNPSQGSFYLSFENDFRPEKVEVFCSNGLLMNTNSKVSTAGKYSFENFKSGLYFVRVQSKGISKIKTLLVD